MSYSFCPGGSGGGGGGGGGGGAPKNCSYLTLSLCKGLKDERVFTPGTGLTAVDGGPGGLYTVSVDSSVVPTLCGTQVAGEVSYFTAPGNVICGDANHTWDSASKTLSLGVASAGTGVLAFYNTASTHYTKFQAGNATADVTYTWPTAGPAADGYALTSTTLGVMSWTHIAGTDGSGNTNEVTYWVNATTIGGRSSFTDTGSTLTYTQPAVAAGAANMWVATGGAHTNSTASTEIIDINFNLARTVQWASGAITTQRAHVVQAPTYAFTGASVITNAATFAITNQPQLGTNATITNAMALWVQAGNIALGSTPSVGGGTGVFFIQNAGGAPGSNPSGGGILYSAAGALTWRGSSGTITTIASA